MQYMAGLGRAQGIRWRLNYIHSMKYAEVINASIAANSAGIDYSYVLNAYLNCVYALVGGVISIRDPYICAVSRKESHAVFHRPVVCAVKT